MITPQAALKDEDQELLKAVEGFVYDPLGFVYFVYPWGEEGPLKDEEGPDKWQADQLRKIGELTEKQATGELLGVVQIAIKAGRDPGKTALIAWIIHWFMSTRPHPQGVVTANTKTQLETKTWRELAKWHKMSINVDWFECTGTKFYLKAHEKTWFAAAIPWSKDRPQAFAGTHENYVIFVFDEGSTIEDIIWETTEGGLTDPYCLWIVVGNPTENTGRFKECFPGGKFATRWEHTTIDARQAKRPNKHKIQEWLEDYGEDSDFFRVWVKGEFPRTAVSQFIGEDVVNEAIKRSFGLKTDIYDWASIVIGVDVARYGDDKSVIFARQGLMTHEVNKYNNVNTMTLAGYVAEKIHEWRAQTVFISSTPDSWGVTDRLRQLGFENIVEVTGGGPAAKEDEYFNKRSEMWHEMKKWLLSGASIPDDSDLKADLIGPRYGFDKRSRVQLETKKDMKARDLSSPDTADALSYTFAQPVVRDERRVPRTQAEKDYDLITRQTYEKYQGDESVFEVEDEY